MSDLNEAAERALRRNRFLGSVLYRNEEPLTAGFAVVVPDDRITAERLHALIAVRAMLGVGGFCSFGQPLVQPAKDEWQFPQRDHVPSNILSGPNTGLFKALHCIAPKVNAVDRSGPGVDAPGRTAFCNSERARRNQARRAG